MIGMANEALSLLREIRKLLAELLEESRRA